MGIFGPSSAYDADIEKATSEKNTNECWTHILDVCDKVNTQPGTAKECLKAIMKRMGHQDPHVVMQAITLLDACVSNCGKKFHLVIASREFENDFRRLLKAAQPKVSLRMRQVLKNWVETDFKNDPELNLIPSLYQQLRGEGYDFTDLGEKPKSAAKMAALRDPNVVSSQKEEEEIAMAIELSLQEAKNSPKKQTSASASASAGNYPSLYPSFNTTLSSSTDSSSPATVAPEARKVRAMYDFEAAEENELTFFAGEIIHVTDDSDPNWWKGYNQRGDGLFPSNFVTADLSVDPKRLDAKQQSDSIEEDTKELQQKTEAAAAAAANKPIAIDEAKVDRLLHLLHEANPEDPSQDTEEMLRLEQEVHQMGPLIDAELELVDRKHAQLTQLSVDLVDAINFYHTLMRDDRAAAAAMMTAGYRGSMAGYAAPGAAQPPPPHMLYGGTPYASGSFGATASLQNHMPPHMAMGAAAAQAPNVDMNYAHMRPLNQQMLAMPPYQNGRLDAAQVNGSNSAAVSSVPSMQNHIYGTLPQAGLQTLQQQQFAPQAAMQMPGLNSAMAPNYAANTLQQHQQQQQQQQLQAQQQQQPTQQIPQPQPQLQQQQQQQPPAPQQPPQQPAFMPQQPTATNFYNMQQQQQPLPNYMPVGVMSAPPTQAGLTNGNGSIPNSGYSLPGGNDLNQLQQQMHAMSIGASMNQPVTQNFLVQNEPKNHVPIYQQQR